MGCLKNLQQYETCGFPPATEETVLGGGNGVENH